MGLGLTVPPVTASSASVRSRIASATDASCRTSPYSSLSSSWSLRDASLEEKSHSNTRVGASRGQHSGRDCQPYRQCGSIFSGLWIIWTTRSETKIEI